MVPKTQDRTRPELTQPHPCMLIQPNSLTRDQTFFRQHAASIYGFVRKFRQFRQSKKIRVSVRCITLCVRLPPFENMCVRSLGYIGGASPPLVCVLSLEDNLRWILGCCLPRFAAFLHIMPVSFLIKQTHVSCA